MTKTTHTIDGRVLCGDYIESPTQITLSNFTVGACGGPTPEPPGRLKFGRITWGVNQSTSLNVNLTQWANVYGRGGNVPAVPFPGPTGTGSGPAIWIPAGQYVALEFVANANGKFGNYLIGNLPIGPNFDIAVSEKPGDFTGLVGEPGSTKTNVAINVGVAALSWMINPANHNVSYAHLIQGKTYFLNLRHHDIGSGTQPLYLQHNHN